MGRIQSCREWNEEWQIPWSKWSNRGSLQSHERNQPQGSLPPNQGLLGWNKRLRRMAPSRREDDPNKYQIVSLMDVCSKVFSRILCTQSYKLLAKHGTKHQYGATPNCGCQDGNFTLKSILHLWRQHNQDIYVVFTDLIKANDTYNHEVMLKILEQYRYPPKFRDSIKRLYTNLKVIVKIGREKAEINQEVGTRQGDNVSLD